MKKFVLLCVVFLFGILSLSSCTGNKAQVTIYDGELQWPSILYAKIWSGTDNAGDAAIWAPHFQTEIGNSLRGIYFSLTTCEPGSYSGVFNSSTKKWSTNVILGVTLNVDYDGTPYPTWRGRSATLTIHSYNKRTKRIHATLEAMMLMDGSTDTRNIRVEMKNLSLKGN